MLQAGDEALPSPSEGEGARRAGEGARVGLKNGDCVTFGDPNRRRRPPENGRSARNRIRYPENIGRLFTDISSGFIVTNAVYKGSSVGSK